MSWVRSILREVFGLFVDDAGFALSILVWLGAVWLVLPRFAVAPGWNGIILFVGLALILLDSAVRQARR
ncbi:MAG: hypothetical protein ABI369_06095 [Acetobacteraceae bacterium]